MRAFPTVDGVTVFTTAPTGYVANFDDPARKNELAAYILAGVGIPLAFLFFGQFLYIKLWLLRKPDAETACLSIGWASSIALQIVLLISFAWSLMGVHTWEISLAKFNMGSRMMVLTPVLYAIETGFTKTSLILFYHKLSPQRWWRICVYFSLFLVIGYNTAVFFAVLLGCRPIAANWDIEVKGECVNRPVIYIATAGLGILTDLILLVMPIPMIVRLQMPPRQKLGLILLFAIGSATLITSVVRLILLIPILHEWDATWVFSNAVVWVFVEANLLVVCASLTTIRRFVLHVAPKLIGEHNAKNLTGGRRHRFRTIGAFWGRKKDADKFGMAPEQAGGFDLKTIGQASPTETAIGKGGDGDTPEKAIAKHLRRQESLNKFADTGSEDQIWEEDDISEVDVDDIDVERAILQTTTVTVMYEERKKKRASLGPKK